MSPRPLFTIAADLPFLDTLAAGLLALAQGDPLALAQQTVLLPTRRAVRSLREAFLRRSDGRPLLLPRLLPVGDVNADELALAGEEADAGAADILPAVPELRRLLLLTRLVLAWGQARQTGPESAGQAVPLARALARFLDEVQTEGCDLAELGKLVPEDYAVHWQQSLEFLGIVSEHWPRLLAEIGCIDPAEHRHRALAAQAALWRREPPKGPVIAAGLTGGVKAVAELIATIATVPQGAIVLAGLDPDVDAETWGAIAEDPAHPQHLSALLLRRLEAVPADLRPWPAPGSAAKRRARRRLVWEAMLPARESHRWRTIAPVDAGALQGMMRIDCPSEQEEALAIALLMRQCLDEPGKRAALVTPDRGLARRVAAELKRWDIAIDDSAGTPLNQAPPGVFLRLILDLAAAELAPLPLLAALKHPLAAGGRAAEAFRAMTRRLELKTLRGPRPAPGFSGLRASLAREDRALETFLDDLQAAIDPLAGALGVGVTELGTLVRAHVAAAEALAASDSESGAARLWREEAGEAAAHLIAELIDAAPDLPKIPARDYPALFEALLAGRVVRPHFGRHPRLAIWGLLEARLQQADLLILGGLNEDLWPPRVDSDPWLSRPMRRQFGLPPPERRIGVTAQDFTQALGAPEIVLTRAARVAGAPTVPSRWLLRLETVLDASGLSSLLAGEPEPLAWQALLDRAERRVAAPPAPRPPVALRPRRLSVTQIETWMRDPYALYARAILRLRALEPIDADPAAADRGRFIHEALDRFLHEFPAHLPEDAAERLIALGESVFGTALERPGVRAFWWPRFERIARWFVAEERRRRPLLRTLWSEIEGSMALAGPAGPFTLSTKADRIERLSSGELVLIDYKTGGVPAPSEVEQGYASQLPLEAAIAAAGGFPGIAAAPIAALAYWQLTGGEPPGDVKLVAAEEASAGRLVDEALAGLKALIARFDDPRTPYRAVPRPERAPRYSDYQHLARVKEWLAAGESE